jgi:hypothetical protein
MMPRPLFLSSSRNFSAMRFASSKLVVGEPNGQRFPAELIQMITNIPTPFCPKRVIAPSKIIARR